LPIRRVLNNVVFYAGLFALWLWIIHIHVWPTYLFPAPHNVFTSLHSGFSDGSFVIAIATSMRRVVIGYAISLTLGLLLSLLIASNEFFFDALSPLLTGLQNLPSICWFPLALLWFGLGENAIYFVIIMGSVPSITMAVEAGIQSMPRIYSQVGRNLGATGPKLFLHVLLPAAFPHLVAGMKQGWAFAWRALFSAEMLSITIGLGQQLIQGRDLNDMGLVMAVMGIILALGLTVNALVFRSLERWIARRWGTATT
jgi:NitT/TauT family transport system permease protein